MPFDCADVFLVYFLTFGSSPVSEGLPKVSLGSEEPQPTSQQRKGNKIYFKTLRRTQPKKVSMQDSLPPPDSVPPSFPLSLEFPGFLTSPCPCFTSAPHSSLQTILLLCQVFSFFFLLMLPCTWLWGCHAADFGNSSWPRIFNANTFRFSLSVSENTIDPFWAVCLSAPDQMRWSESSARLPLLKERPSGLQAALSGELGREEVTGISTRVKFLNFWALIGAVLLHVYSSSLLFAVQHLQSC